MFARLALTCLLAFSGLPGVCRATDAIATDPPSLSDAMDRISAERMMTDIAELSGSRFNGRQAGTDHDYRSAVWVAQRFAASGLTLAAVPDRLSMGSADQPPTATGFMSDRMTAVAIGDDPTLRIGPPSGLRVTRLRDDYLPVLDSPTADVQGPVVFVGYGMPEDYVALDVHNCIVLFLRGKPDHASHGLSHAEKVGLARDKGALAYLTATGPLLKSYELRRGITGSPSAFYAQLPPADTIPGAWVSTALAEELLAGDALTRGGTLREAQEQLNRAASSRSIRTDSYAALRWGSTAREGPLVNVLALLPGTGPDTIVMGAHRDHFGNTAGLVFPGADDNASGTAVMLEVARVLSAVHWRPARTVLFISFSGEERDLLGSRLYVRRPAADSRATKAMINIDHAGAGNGRLTVGVTGMERTVASDAGHAAGLETRVDLFGFFPGGDHVPFTEVGIPTLTVVSGGIHPHFHQPSDTVETIDPEILRSVARYVLAVVWQLAGP
jgi:hypothetical protein